MPTKRRILIACDSSRSLLDFRGKLIEALVESNDVAVFTPLIEQAHIRAKLDSLGVTIFENGLNGSNVSILSDLKYIVHLYRVISKYKPDVFFPYTLKPVIYGTLVANFSNISLVTPMLTGLGYNFSDGGSGNSLVKRITHTLLKVSLSSRKKLKLILQNSDDYQTLLNHKIINSKSEAFVVNGSGVDLSHYDYSVPDAKNISFLMVSRLINAKGVNEYYEAAKAIRAKFPGVKFRLIGAYDDNIDAIDKELYEKIKSGDVIEYSGHVNDVRACIKEASIIVLPSYYGEGVPRCILEAMAMGRPVITSNSVGCKETVNIHPNHVNGFLVPVKNVQALAAKMEYFIKNTADIVEFGLRGRNYAREKFDVYKVNHQMLNIMELQ